MYEKIEVLMRQGISTVAVEKKTFQNANLQINGNFVVISTTDDNGNMECTVLPLEKITKYKLYSKSDN